MKTHIQEVIFIGLPGPTHNYGGLSADNVASSTNQGSVSSPKQAALQVLALARLLMSLGVTVGVLPPQLRPHLRELREHFSGTEDEVIAQAARQKPELLEKMCSSSAMWVANAATISPGRDNADGRLHLTTANLQTNLHRRIEAADTHRVLAAIFAQVPDVVAHAPLPPALPDEGAANHTRLAPTHNHEGMHVLVYGANGGPDDPPSARQAFEASQAVARQHGIRRVLFIKQNPAVIRAGVFHNDVIAVGNEHVLIAHESAFAGGQTDVDTIKAAYRELNHDELTCFIVPESELSIEEAVHTYFFNSQLLTLPDGSMALIAPQEVKELYGGKALRLMERFGTPISAIHTLDLRQSMNNGGGPACLRLRAPLTDAQIIAIKTSVNVLADENLLVDIERIVREFYPDELHPKDIANPELYWRSKSVVESLGALMKLPV